MTMAKRLDSATERRLTHCIEKAASLAAVDEKRDRSELLAKCLMGDNIDTKLAKTASRAFNKRLTVLMLTKTADEHKPDKFQLADPDRVHELVGGRQEIQIKTAGFSVPPARFKISLEKTTEMRKTAASPKEYRQLPYELRVSPEVYERHLLSCMDKMAAAHSEMLGRIHGLECDINRQKEELRRELDKTAAFTVQVLATVYGDRFEKAFPGLLKGRGLRKNARAVDPGTDLSGRVGGLLDSIDKHAAEVNAGIEFQRQIEEFSSGAAKIGDAMHKVAAIGLLGGIAARTGYGLGAAAISAAHNALGEAAESYRRGIGNVRSMMNATDPEYFNPANVLDPKSITTEKYFDQALALSDALADPVIASYPTKDVMAAADQLFTKPPLRDPSNRMLLKSELQKLLAQNNVVGIEDVAQLTSILKDQDKATSELEKAVAQLGGLHAKEAPQAASFERVMKEFKPSKDPGEILEKIHEANKTAIKEYAEKVEKKRLEEKADKEKAELKAEREREKRERDAMEQTRREEQAQEKAQNEALKRLAVKARIPEDELNKLDPASRDDLVALTALAYRIEAQKKSQDEKNKNKAKAAQIRSHMSPEDLTKYDSQGAPDDPVALQEFMVQQRIENWLNRRGNNTGSLGRA